MRFLRRLTLVAVLAVLFAWLRKVLSEEVLKRSPEAQAPTPPVGRDPTPKPAPPADVSGKPAGNGAEPTKAELYERAQELGIEGRSRMSKAELQREISRRD
jgi:Rho termination factor, N-terminal domain